MTSFYVRTPSGFEIEYGYGGALVDVSQPWVAGDLRLGQHLGPQAPRAAAVPGHHPTGRDERVSPRIDTHHHVVPPELRRLAARQGRAGRRPADPRAGARRRARPDGPPRRADGRPVRVDAGCPPRRRRRRARHGARRERVRGADVAAITPTASASSRRCRSPTSTARSTSSPTPSTPSAPTASCCSPTAAGTYLGDESFDPLFDELQRRQRGGVRPPVDAARASNRIDGIPAVRRRLPARHHPRGREPGPRRAPSTAAPTCA